MATVHYSPELSWSVLDDLVSKALPTSEIPKNVTEKEFRILQPIWDLRLGYEHLIASPLFPIVFSVAFYFVCMVPWTIIDLYGRNWNWIQKYKIQPQKEVTWGEVVNGFMLTLWNHLLYILPVSLAQWVWTPDTPLPELAPSFVHFLVMHLVTLTIFDFEYWVFHYLHHKIPFLYRHVHAVHHEYYVPNCWVTQYLHPWELISVGIFTTTSPWILGLHPMTEWSFMQFSIIISVDNHIGYDLPFLMHNWLPFYGGSIKHDMHHQKPRTNFEPFFNYWDRLFGFECPGQRAGGYKPPKLLEWEKNSKRQFRERNEKAKIKSK